MKQARPQIILLHLLGCLVFLCIPLFSAPPGVSILSDSFALSEVLEYAFTIGFFYLNYFYLIPRFYFRKRYLAFIAFALLGFVLVSVLPELILPGAVHPPPGPPGNPGHPPEDAPGAGFHWQQFGPLDENLLKYSTAFILAITLRVTGQLRRIQEEKAESELKLLRAQVQPHFLFNTLNSIYALSLEAGASRAAEAIVQLSGLMRYAVEEIPGNEVPLEKELDYIDNYVRLQRLRINDRVKLSYQLDGSPGDLRIAPFLMIPFIENAFKYGVSAQEPSEIGISVRISGRMLSLLVRNRKHPKKPDPGRTSIGIANTRSRLALLYPGRHLLELSDSAASFEVTLNITL